MKPPYTRDDILAFGTVIADAVDRYEARIKALESIATCAEKVLDNWYEFGHVYDEWADALQSALEKRK